MTETANEPNIPPDKSTNAETDPSLNETIAAEPLMYSREDYGPFLVLVESSDANQPIGKLHIMGVGRRLLKAGINGLVQTEKAGQNRVKLTFKTGYDANNFLKHNILQKENWQAYVPISRIRKRGVVFGVDPTESEDEVFSSIESCVEVTDVRRITKFENGNRVPMSMVEVTFKGQNLPHSIKIYSVPYRVKPSIPQPILCRRCWRFGHKENQCRGSPRCFSCGSSPENEVCQTKKCNMKCLHCDSKDHNAADKKSCPEWKKQTEIKRVMYERNISFHQARLMFSTKPQQGYNVAMNEFPPLIKNYKRKADKEEMSTPGSARETQPSEVKMAKKTLYSRRHQTDGPSTLPTTPADKMGIRHISTNSNNFFHTYASILFLNMLKSTNNTLPEEKVSEMVQEHFGPSILKQLGIVSGREDHSYSFSSK